MKRILVGTSLAVVTASTVFASAGSPARAATTDPFYTYSGSAPLSSYAPGAILKSRTVSYAIGGGSGSVVQLLYRSTDARGGANAAVTSIFKPANPKAGAAISYESAYDSLNPEDGPSRLVAAGKSSYEMQLIGIFLSQGYTVIEPDSQGPTADFAAGPEYGTVSLDSIRAATHSKDTGLNTSTKVGLAGYSGGAIGANWSAVLAPSYAPDVNKNLVGASEGGLLVAPARNLRYVDGSQQWSGITPMALIGVARAYGITFDKYLSPYGKKVMNELQSAIIGDVVGHYPGLTWKQLVKPEYANPDSIKEFVTAANKLNLGSLATPNIPMSIVQASGADEEGTIGNKPGIGPGDGVMISGDVRSLARQYCKANNAIQYQQVDGTGHTGAVTTWATSAVGWLGARFAGAAAPSSCGNIAAGNSLAPETYVPPTPPPTSPSSAPSVSSTASSTGPVIITDGNSGSADNATIGAGLAAALLFAGAGSAGAGWRLRRRSR
ncbi:lipase family protein [Flexivirga alba]|uniref:Lipase family protein n=1 Tax=Flexivirga alba TaxID=702742 RepID=A0ABW2ACP7_9MICO